MEDERKKWDVDNNANKKLDVDMWEVAGAAQKPDYKEQEEREQELPPATLGTEQEAAAGFEVDTELVVAYMQSHLGEVIDNLRKESADAQERAGGLWRGGMLSLGDKSQREISRLKSKVTDVLSEMEMLEKDRNFAREKWTELERQITYLQTESQRQISQMDQTVEVTCSEMVMRRHNYQCKMKEMTSEVDHQMAVNNRLRQMLLEAENRDKERRAQFNEVFNGMKRQFQDANNSLSEEKRFIEGRVKELGMAKIRTEEELAELKSSFERLVAEGKGELKACEEDKKRCLEMIAFGKKQMEEYKKEIDGSKVIITRLSNEKKLTERKVADAMKEIERVELERKELDDAKSWAEDEILILRDQVFEWSKSYKAREEDYAKIEGEKKELKVRSESFNKEILSLRAQLAEANAGLDKVLKMLKATAVSVGGSNEEMGRVSAKKLNESQINPHMLELESIKKGLKDREIKVEDMKREVECLKNSVVRANKRKSFMAIVSSATTLFAAISLAYAARPLSLS